MQPCLWDWRCRIAPLYACRLSAILMSTMHCLHYFVAEGKGGATRASEKVSLHIEHMPCDLQCKDEEGVGAAGSEAVSLHAEHALCTPFELQRYADHSIYNAMHVIQSTTPRQLHQCMVFDLQHSQTIMQVREQQSASAKGRVARALSKPAHAQGHPEPRPAPVALQHPLHEEEPYFIAIHNRERELFSPLPHR
eukprot:165914-Rhodomonas_salina.2